MRELPARIRPFIAAVAFAIGLSSAFTDARAEDGPFAKFQHGINLSNWLANAQRQPLFERDFQQIKAAGFDHVRLPINPEFLGFSLNEAATGRILFDFAPVDQALGYAFSNGLSVILDVHPSDGFMTLIEQDTKAESGLIGLWQHLAEHFKLTAPSSLAFEILNEPRYTGDVARYSDLMADLVSTIRAAAPNHMIIIDAPKSATLEGLQALKPFKDDKIYYAFHFYEPNIFTHQGIVVGSQGKATRYFRNVPYPSALANLNTNYAPTASDALEAKKELADYALADWNYSHIQARLKLAADWAATNHAHIICTEFGAQRNFVNSANRYQWIADTRKALEADGIGWDLWDYTDIFGITKLIGNTSAEPGDHSVRLVDPEKGSREFELDALKVLFSR